jgi:hypothetical protein
VDTKPLPVRPNVEQYKKQAKSLLNGYKAGDASAIERIRRYHPRFETILRRKFALADAQLILAREHGFESWPKFVKHVRMLEAIRSGDVPVLQRLLRNDANLARVSLPENITGKAGSRSLLHVVTDWPGHSPNAAAIVRVLVDAGADVNATFGGHHSETPLHWAASSDDVEALDALLDRGADIDARGGVIGGGTPLDDAVVFRQWKAAQRLVERGAGVNLWHSAALGLIERIEQQFGDRLPSQYEINHAFWSACHGAQRKAAEYLLKQGAEINWLPPWENLTPLDAARGARATSLFEWLRSQGAKSAEELADFRK